MKVNNMYSVKIKDKNKVFRDTVSLYRKAVDWYIIICLEKWDDISALKKSKERMNFVQSISTTTKEHPNPEYDFTSAFYKFPVYLRRAAIMEALGKVSSYKSNLANWEKNPTGRQPGLPKAGFVYPALYRGNTFVRKSDYVAEVKVFIRNTWDWIPVQLKKSDVDYIKHHCSSMKECVPTLQKRGKQWFLDFAFEKFVTLNETELKDQIVAGVDLGINSACVCSVLKSDGTVIGRKFLSLPKENDCLTHRLNKIKQAQQLGNTHMPRLWASAKGMNDRIAVLTAQFIISTALEYNANVIVFEKLDKTSKKHGSKKQRLHMWKADYVQAMVAQKAHMHGMRISHICAWNTSKLAFDGSGAVIRGKEAGLNTYSLCRFTNGKVYNCDLSASYNIGSRYFIRELLKSCSEKDRLDILAKVPECSKRTTCTLSSLIRLNTVLCA